jgi:hypothetical protein
MTEFNIEVMDVLIKAHQEELRRSGELRLPRTDSRPVRQVAGNVLIRFGEWLGGTHRMPVQPARPGKLALPRGGTLDS